MNGQPFTITDPDNSQWARRVTNGISLDQAARLFMGQDDLVFNLPNDRTLPAQQQYEPAPGADGQWGIAGIDDNGNGTVDDIGEAMWPGSDDFRCQRQWEGKFSWMATITPKLSGSSDLYVRDLYVLSVVVFHRRDLTVTGEKVMPKVIVTMDSTTDYTQNPNILTNLVSAAEVVLQSGNADDLKMKEGEWIMLADAVGSTNFRWFRWYRIQTVDDSPHPPVLSSLTTYAYERNLTLLGPDWPVVDSDVSMRATWIPGVVAVYEKTIRLETSSLWTDL
jgi:hypothetical protein